MKIKLVELLTIPEAAERVGITRMGMWELVEKGKFTAYERAGGDRLLKADEVDEFIKQRSRGERRPMMDMTKTYQMIDLACEECGALFAVVANQLAYLRVNEGFITCPICGAELALEAEEEEPEDENNDLEEEGDAEISLMT